MKFFTRLMIVCLTVMVVFAVIANIVLIRTANYDTNQLYNVEINRLLADLEQAEQYRQPDLAECKSVYNVSYLPVGATRAEAELFYQIGNDPVVIKPLYHASMVAGYVKFTYRTSTADAMWEFLLLANILFLIFILATGGILFYIREKVLKPFETYSELPEQMARGYLTKPVYAQKNQYFGRFLWGLDMLRESLVTQRQQSNEVEREKKTLILSLSHDLKTPLSAIKLYTKALKEDLYEDPEKQREVIGRIEQKAQDIDTFVRDMIRGTTEGMLAIDVQNSEFYLEALLTALQDNYREKLSLLHAELEIGAYMNCMLYGDLDRTIEALENTIENALKYGDGKGVQLSFLREENCQLIVVTNTGNTLPRDEIVHIFDSFWRGSNAKGQSGSGLGLYIARQIMHKMDGDIYADAEGDKMHVTLVLKLA